MRKELGTLPTHSLCYEYILFWNNELRRRRRLVFQSPWSILGFCRVNFHGRIPNDNVEDVCLQSDRLLCSPQISRDLNFGKCARWTEPRLSGRIRQVSSIPVPPFSPRTARATVAGFV